MTIFTEENLIAPREWSKRAACVGEDPDTFFPGKSDVRTAEQAKAICARCPVAAQCLADALERREPHGIFGGLNASERARLLAGQKPKRGPHNTRGPLPRVCSVGDCYEPHQARGFCNTHYRTMWREAKHRPCQVEGCTGRVRALDKCHAHYMQARRAEAAAVRHALNPRPTVCGLEGCDAKHYAKGLCRPHYRVEQRRSETRVCVRHGCDRTRSGSRGLCTMHYSRELKAEKETKG